MLNALVVDDDVNIGLFISRLLEKRFNCKVQSVTDGSEALKIIKVFKPDIIFLDVTMPGMDGLQTMEAIKASREFSGVPIVMITAINEKNTVMKAMEMGAVAYILKPLVFLPVYEKIKEVIEKFKSTVGKNDSKTYTNKDFSLKKILVVDSDKNFAERIKSKLDDNYHLFSCSSGIDGLAIYNQEKPGLVILSELIDDINIDLLTDRIKSASSDVALFIIKEEEKLTSREEKLWENIFNHFK